MRLRPIAFAFATTVLVAASAAAQAPPAPAAPPQDAAAGARARMSRQVAPGPDDKPAYPEPPASAFERRDNVARGRLELVEYDSKTVGTRRKAYVYTPPGYSADRRYPVAYLLHGIGGDEGEWLKFATPDVLFDNLIADKAMEPFIAVFPNGRAQKNDRAEGNVFASAPAFAVFERDLLDDLIPFVEGRYSVKADRESRALAGLSMGGGQTLNFGFAHLDRFAWLGAFSPAPNSKAPELLVPDPAAAKKQLKLFMLTCGSKDGLLDISQKLHAYLKQHDVPHVYHVDGHAHTPPHWRAALHAFAQRIFR
jgi:enterochelin esterase-like enzyme